jgi:hypothetical protein
MKECKKMVLKTHPDKSQLDNKYFIFFSSAYKKLLTIYEFQNKVNSKKTTTTTSEYHDTNNGEVLDKMFDMNSELKDPKNFNQWFNKQFEKHRLEDPVSSGYGNWLKSDEDIVFTPTNITKDKMASEIEKRKKEVKAVTNYTGINDTFSSTFGGSSLMAYDSNFTSGSLFSNEGMGYTDLRQAYAESVIPVTEEDYNKTMLSSENLKINKYKNMLDINYFHPLSFNLMGSPGPKTMLLFKNKFKQFKLLNNNISDNYNNSLSFLFKRIDIIIAKYNYKIFNEFKKLNNNLYF